MMSIRVSAMVVLVTLSCARAALEEDRIVDLPGLNYEINFEHYSGYLDAGEGNMLHYWFTESQKDPANDPVLLWLNGGPGCSSLEGLLTELGPYFVNADGTELYENPYSWNTFANVIFLESPACVGFSYDENATCKVSDDGVAEQNYLALKDFFGKFPEFMSNEFYITGESFAGVYIPTLSMRVIEGLDEFALNFTGFAIGNGLLSYKSNSNSLYFFGYHHGLLGQDLWDNMVDGCCGGVDSRDTCDFFLNMTAWCEASVLKAEKLLYYGGLDMYNLYADCLHPEETNSTSSYEMDLNNLRLFSPSKSLHETRADPPCTDSTNLRAYLNSVETRTALHIPEEVGDWDICNRLVSLEYLHQYFNMHDTLLEVTANVRGLIYNGDVDMACNVIGNTWDVDSLNLETVKGWEKWTDGNQQVGGYVKSMQNLDFVTIRGSGHMVPTDKPMQALQVIKAFIFSDPY